MVASVLVINNDPREMFSGCQWGHDERVCLIRQPGSAGLGTCPPRNAPTGTGTASAGLGTGLAGHRMEGHRSSHPAATQLSLAVLSNGQSILEPASHSYLSHLSIRCNPPLHQARSLLHPRTFLQPWPDSNSPVFEIAGWETSDSPVSALVLPVHIHCGLVLSWPLSAPDCLFP